VRRYEASEGRKENKRQYEASEGRQEVAAAAHKRTRVFLEAYDNGERPAVQQKTNGPQPQLGYLAALLGGS
jgi:hypothetical protein